MSTDLDGRLNQLVSGAIEAGATPEDIQGVTPGRDVGIELGPETQEVLYDVPVGAEFNMELNPGAEAAEVHRVKQLLQTGQEIKDSNPVVSGEQQLLAEEPVPIDPTPEPGNVPAPDTVNPEKAAKLEEITPTKREKLNTVIPEKQEIMDEFKSPEVTDKPAIADNTSEKASTGVPEFLKRAPSKQEKVERKVSDTGLPDFLKHAADNRSALQKAADESRAEASKLDRAIQALDRNLEVDENALADADGLERNEAIPELAQAGATIFATSARMVGWARTSWATAAAHEAAQRAGDTALELWSTQMQYDEHNKSLDNMEVTLDLALLSGQIDKVQHANGMSGINEKRLELIPLGSEENAHLDEVVSGGQTRRQLVEQSYKKYEEAAGYREQYDYSHLIQNQRRDRLHGGAIRAWEEAEPSFVTAGEAWEKGDWGTFIGESIVGTANYMGGVGGAIWRNPAATLGYAIENTPFLIAGRISPLLLGGINVAYGLDIYDNAVNEFIKENDKQPSSKQKAAMFAIGQAAGALEQIGDISILRALDKIPGADRLSKFFHEGPAKKTLEKLAEKGVTGKVAEALINNPATRLTANLSRPALTEGVTELAQTAIEETYSHLKTELDPEAMSIGFVAGFGSGGTFAAPRAAGYELARAGQKALLRKQAGDDSADRSKASAADLQEQVEKSADTGDVTAFVDPGSPFYEPAMGAIALQKRLAREGLSEEDRTATEAELGSLVAQQEEALTALNKALDLSSEENLQSMQEDIDLFEEQAQDESLTESERRQAAGIAQSLTQALESAQKTDREAVEDAITVAERNLELMTLAETHESRHQTVLGLAESLKQYSDPESTPEQRVEAADAIILSAMENPDILIPNEQLTALKSDEALTPEQRQIITTYSEAHAAVNASKDVSEVSGEVINGGKGFKGLNDYMAVLSRAVKRNNSKLALGEQNKLRNFYSELKNKRDLVERMLKAAKKQADSGGGKQFFFVYRDPNEEGGYKLGVGRQNAPWSKGPEGDVERSALGGMFVWSHQLDKASGFLEAIDTDLEAIEAVGKFFKQVIDENFEGEVVAEPQAEAETEAVQEDTSEPEAATEPQPVSEPAPEEVVSEPVPEGRTAEQEADELEKAQLTHLVQNDLISVAEGNNALVPDPNFVRGESDKPGEVPLVRTSSLNPDWFQNNEDMTSVKEVRKAVAAYVAGKKLGKKQTRIVEALKAVLEDEREEADRRYGEPEETAPEETNSAPGDTNPPPPPQQTPVPTPSPANNSNERLQEIIVELSAKVNWESVAEDGEIDIVEAEIREEAEEILAKELAEGAPQASTESQQSEDPGASFDDYADTEQDEGPPPVDDQDPGFDPDEDAVPFEEDGETFELNLPEIEDNPIIGPLQRDEDFVGQVSNRPEHMTQEELTNPEENRFLARYFRRITVFNGVPNPLYAVKDFMNTLWADGKLNMPLLQQFLPKAPTERQLQLLGTFQSFHEAFAPIIRENLEMRPRQSHKTGPKRIPNEEFYTYRWKDLSTDLSENVTENLVTAIAAAAFQQIIEMGENDINYDDDIRAMLNLDDDATVTNAMREELAGLGLRQSFFVRQAGKKAAQAWGVKAKGGENPRDSQNKLEMALGGQVLALLTHVDNDPDRSINMFEHLESNAGALFHNYDNGPYMGPPDKPSARFHSFVRIRRNENGVLDQNVLSVTAEAKETAGIISKLFGITPKRSVPRNTAELKTVKRDNTDLGVSKTQERIEKKVAKRRFRPKVLMDKVQKAFGREFLAKAHGLIDMEGIIHEENRKAYEAKNRQIETELDLWYDFLEENGTDQPFYLTPQIQKNGRSQYMDTIDPQKKKIHRHMMSMYVWETEIDPNQDTEAMNLFLIAVGAGLGIDVTQQNDEDSVSQTLAKIDELQEAIDVLKAVIQDQEVTPEMQEAALKGVQDAGEGMHSLDVLTEVANYQIAVANGTSFKTDIMFEVDGIANGPALLNLQFGTMINADGDNMAPMFGFYNDAKYGFKDFRSQGGNLDMYEYMAYSVHQIIQDMIADPGNAAATVSNVDTIYRALGLVKYDNDGVETILGFASDAAEVSKPARKLIKEPMRPLAFGSSVTKAVDNMTVHFIYGFYGAIEKAANSLQGLEKVNEIAGHYNAMLSESNQIPVFESIEQAMNYSLVWDQMAELENVFQGTVGTAVSEAVDTKLKDFTDAQKEIVKISEAIHMRFREAFSMLYAQKLNELTKNGNIATNKSGEPVQDLNNTQVKEIMDELHELGLTPYIHTPMSRMDDDLLSGLSLGKHHTISMPNRKVRSIRDNNPEQLSESQRNIPDHVWNLVEAYSARVQPGNGVQTTGYKGGTYNQLNLNVTGVLNFEGSPGVSTPVNYAHSMDSAVATLAREYIAMINIHDAGGAGIEQIQEMSRAFNKALWDLSTTNHLGIELATALHRSLSAQRALSEKHPEIAERLVNLVYTPRGRNPKSEAIGPNMYRTYLLSALQQKLDKLYMMRDVKTVDQYTRFEGWYEPTAEDKAAIEAEIGRTEAEIERVRAKQNRQTPSEASQAPQSASTGERAQVKQASNSVRTEPQDTPWGRVGRSTGTHASNLLKFFRDTSETTLGTLFPYLEDAAAAQGMPEFQQKWYKQILAALEKTANMDTKIVLITPDTPFSSEFKNLKTALGFTATFRDDTTGTIYVKSPYFVNSGLSAELLLHEVLHAHVDSMVAKYENMKEGKVKKGEKEVWQAVQDLKEMYEQVKDLDLPAEHKHALANLREFISWGMTNGKFMNVLDKQLASEGVSKRTQARVEGSRIREFIRGLVKLLWGVTNNKTTGNRMNMLAAHLANVHILLENQYAEMEGSNKRIISRMENDRVDPHTMTAEEVFEALHETGAQVDPAFQNHLRNVLNTIVDSMFLELSPYKKVIERETPVTTEDEFIQAMLEERSVWSSEIAQRLGLSSQNQYVLEAVEAAVQASLNASKAHRREMRRLFEQAREELTPQDFGGGLKGQMIWDTLFLNTTVDGDRTKVLSAFAAAALTYKPLHDALQDRVIAMDNKSLFDGTFAEAVQLFFSRLATWLGRIGTDVHNGQLEGHAWEALARTLVQLEVRRKTELSRSAGPVEAISELTTNMSEAVRGAIETTLGSKIFRESGSGIIRGTTAVGRAIAGKRFGEMMDVVQEIRDQNTNDKLGFLSSLYNEVRLSSPLTRLGVQLLSRSNHHEQERKQYIDDFTKNVKDRFLNWNSTKPAEKRLNKAKEEAVKFAAVDTDMQALLGSFSLPEIVRLMRDPAYLESEIQAREGFFNGHQHEKYFIASAKHLAWYMVTGINYDGDQAFNAHNIAHMVGTDTMIVGENGEASLNSDVLDVLITLYAMKYQKGQKGAEMELAAETFAEELSRPSNEENGMEYLLRLYRQAKEDSITELFDGNEVHFQKGYSKDILDPHVDIKAASELEGEQLKRMGYKKVSPHPLGKDPVDPTGVQRYLWIAPTAGLNPTYSGAMIQTDQKHQGFAMHSGVYSQATDTVHYKNRKMQRAMNQAKKHAADNKRNTPLSWDPSKVNQGQAVMAPVYNNYGEVVNYRYIMNNHTRDTLLRRENRVSKVTGYYQASIVDKAATPVINENVVDALHGQFREDYLNSPQSYIEVGPNSQDPQIREAYRLLPYATREHIKSVWGKETMLVRNDMYDMIFGYRKWSVKTLFEKEQFENAWYQQAFVGLMEFMFGRKAALRAVQGESIWQTMTKYVKDAWVIKSIFTFLFNELANATQLWAMGVNPTQGIRDKYVAWQSTLQFQQDARELRRLESDLEIGYFNSGQEVTMRQRIAELQDSMDRNPIKPLIDEHMFQTLVEDITTEEDPWGYQSRMDKNIDTWTGKYADTPLVQAPRTALKWIFMTHDTTLYKLANQATIMSDFTSRFALYNHMIQKDGAVHEEVISDVREAFVNYDVPTHRNMQYLNDMGLLWFTKYYARIQKVLFMAAQENPARALVLSLIMGPVFGLQHIFNSSILVNNPINLGAGPLEGLDAVESIITINALGGGADVAL